MRYLLFSDLHRDTKAARRLVDLSRNVDVVVGAGDFGTMRQGVQEVIEVLAVIDRPAVLVPGNSESYDELAEAAKVVEDLPIARLVSNKKEQCQGPFANVAHDVPVQVNVVSESRE